ncbi:PREDICTED: Retrovirus-related Pol poly from transposon [Prunus dulcis]|uniref:PREDICTED: Retrovirus-related Pol poly from transposon n=1 Tax=Prunus dulcis TaxID=3755 RepID=A0A5E4FWD4_PRUDU|nr:PREDICTED: Retrovirus-related Pol poly from transposon [Prunus dulcis]
MEEDKDIPLIFGRPFMATARTLIDVEEGTLTIRITDESVVFKLFDFSKKPHNEDDCFRIDVVKFAFLRNSTSYIIQACLTRQKSAWKRKMTC